MEAGVCLSPTNRKMGTPKVFRAQELHRVLLVSALCRLLNSVCISHNPERMGATGRKKMGKRTIE